jgi:CO/xanthine dehydrogenase FAD-binding subunit
MHPFEYARPGSLAEAVALLAERGPEARVLAGGTDLVIRLRDGSLAPALVVDVKRVPELAPGIRLDGRTLVIRATTVMTDVAADPLVRRHAPALAEAAAVVGSVQIRNRATLAGNVCNASPAADTVPALLVHGAVVVAAGPAGSRRIPVDDLFVRSGVTTLLRGELVTSIELPLPADRIASAHQRRTRRRGHDLASVTVTCGVDATGTTRVAFGSVGPRPLLRMDTSGVLADPRSSAEARAAVFELIFADASPSVRSMRAGPEYRLAMLRVLGRRALVTALERLAMGDPA